MARVKGGRHPLPPSYLHGVPDDEPDDEEDTPEPTREGHVEPVVVLEGATMRNFTLATTGAGYFLTFLIPLDQEDALVSLRKAAHQRQVRLAVSRRLRKRETPDDE